MCFSSLCNLYKRHPLSSEKGNWLCVCVCVKLTPVSVRRLKLFSSPQENISERAFFTLLTAAGGSYYCEHCSHFVEGKNAKESI